MLEALASSTLRLADSIHKRFGDSQEQAAFTAVVDGRSIGYDVIRDDRSLSRSATLVVGLHGFGADEQQLRTLVPLDSVDSPILYVAVRGSWAVTGGGHAWFPISEDINDGFDVDIAELDIAVTELTAFIETASSWPKVSPDRSWLIGYSQGAPVALLTTAQRPDLIAGCAAGAGALLGPLPPDVDLSEVVVLVAASPIDPFVSPDQTDDLRRQLTNAGAHVDVVVDAAPHVITATQAIKIADWLNAHVSPTPGPPMRSGISVARS